MICNSKRLLVLATAVMASVRAGAEAEPRARLVYESSRALDDEQGECEPLVDLAEINAILEPVGAHIFLNTWRPLDKAPEGIMTIVKKDGPLSDADKTVLLGYFSLTREEMLDIISKVPGNTGPSTPDLGDLSTVVVDNLNFTYPRVWETPVVQVQPEEDASKEFKNDKLLAFHRNFALDDDGGATPVDEFHQLLASTDGNAGFANVWQLPAKDGKGEILVHVSYEPGLLIFYKGIPMHCGLFRPADPQLKVVSQIVGPAKWQMEFLDEPKTPFTSVDAC